jgi:hypothetical protein
VRIWPVGRLGAAFPPGGRFREVFSLARGEPDAPGRNGVFVSLAVHRRAVTCGAIATSRAVASIGW